MGKTRLPELRHNRRIHEHYKKVSEELAAAFRTALNQYRDEGAGQDRFPNRHDHPTQIPSPDSRRLFEEPLDSKSGRAPGYMKAGAQPRRPEAEIPRSVALRGAYSSTSMLNLLSLRTRTGPTTCQSS